VAELAYAQGLGPCIRKGVEVRLLSLAFDSIAKTYNNIHFRFHFLHWKFSLYFLSKIAFTKLFKNNKLPKGRNFYNKHIRAEFFEVFLSHNFLINGNKNGFK